MPDDFTYQGTNTAAQWVNQTIRHCILLTHLHSQKRASRNKSADNKLISGCVRMACNCFMLTTTCCEVVNFTDLLQLARFWLCGLVHPTLSFYTSAKCWPLLVFPTSVFDRMIAVLLWAVFCSINHFFIATTVLHAQEKLKKGKM